MKGIIRRKFCLIVTFALILGASMMSMTLETFANDIVVVNATDVNVRALPSTSSTTYGKVNTGTYLTRYETRTDGWSCIDYAGTQAYIKSNFLTAYTGTVATQPATVTTQSAATKNNTRAVSSAAAATQSAAVSSSETVWIPSSGSKYHRSSSCSNMRNPSSVSIDRAISLGYTPCKKCYK